MQEINAHNANVQALTEMWASYNRNVRFNLAQAATEETTPR
jgi:hypothetical protein